MIARLPLLIALGLFTASSVALPTATTVAGLVARDMGAEGLGSYFEARSDAPHSAAPTPTPSPPPSGQINHESGQERQRTANQKDAKVSKDGKNEKDEVSMNSADTKETLELARGALKEALMAIDDLLPPKQHSGDHETGSAERTHSGVDKQHPNPATGGSEREKIDPKNDPSNKPHRSLRHRREILPGQGNLVLPGATSTGSDGDCDRGSRPRDDPRPSTYRDAMATIPTSTAAPFLSANTMSYGTPRPSITSDCHGSTGAPSINDRVSRLPILPSTQDDLAIAGLERRAGPVGDAAPDADEWNFEDF